MLDLSAIEKRCHEASPSPWMVDDITEDVIPDSKEHYWENCPHGCADGDCEGHYKDRACMVHGLAHIPEDSDDGWYFSLPDAEFVAHAREDVPALVARVRELEAALREVPHSDACQDWTKTPVCHSDIPGSRAAFERQLREVQSRCPACRATEVLRGGRE